MKVLLASPLFAVCLLASTARADDPLDPFELDPPFLDVAPRPLVPLASDDGARLGVGIRVAQRQARRDVAGTLTLSLPTDQFLSPPAAAKAKRAPEPSSNDDLATDEEEGSDAVMDRAPRSYVAPPVLPRVRPRDARSAIRAALAASALGAAADDLASLSSRARWSALLPEVRLRATRLLDESTSLSPTSYDPERTTASGGASLWLEARASWRLDRLAFASEEVRIERIRRQLDDERQALTRHVLEALFGWQRALRRAHDPAATPTQCMEAWLDEQQLSAELDLLTEGWHARWLRQHETFPDPPCLGGDDDDGE